MVTWTQIVQALAAVIAAGTVAYLVNRASRKQVDGRQPSDDS